jgi:hypothetical protein
LRLGTHAVFVGSDDAMDGNSSIVGGDEFSVGTASSAMTTSHEVSRVGSAVSRSLSHDAPARPVREGAVSPATRGLTCCGP